MSARNKKEHQDLTIRQYGPADLEACRALWVELTEWHRRIYHDEAIGGPDPSHYFDEHLNKVGPTNLWVADVGGKVVGLTGLILSGSEGEIEPLVVNTSYRGRGIGRRLAEAAIRSARERGSRQLKVRPVGRNELAIRFFHSLGFDIIGQIELFMDFGQADAQTWTTREEIAGKRFRV